MRNSCWGTRVEHTIERMVPGVPATRYGYLTSKSGGQHLESSLHSPKESVRKGPAPVGSPRVPDQPRLASVVPTDQRHRMVDRRACRPRLINVEDVTPRILVAVMLERLADIHGDRKRAVLHQGSLQCHRTGGFR